MINTSILEPDVLLDRLDTLPEPLRIAANNPDTSNIVSITCEQNHITAEPQVLMVQQLVGLVILGFLHDYDLGRELNEALNLNNAKLADDIAKAISAKVFAPIKAELDKNYRPLPGESAEKSGFPHVVVDMKPATLGIPTLIPSSGVKPAGTISFGQAPRPAGAPFASAMSGMPAPKPITAGMAPGATPQAVPMPAPVILHREAEFKPIQQGSSSLRGDILGKPPAGTGATSMFSGRPTGHTPQAPITAKIEFSGSGMMKPQAPIVSRTEASIPRVVHYSDMKTPVSPCGAAEA